MDQLKAYRIAWTHMPDVLMWGAGKTAGQIRYLVMMDALDAGYKLDFKHVTVHREKDLDGEARKGKRPGHLGWLNIKTGEKAGIVDLGLLEAIKHSCLWGLSLPS